MGGRFCRMASYMGTIHTPRKYLPSPEDIIRINGELLEAATHGNCTLIRNLLSQGADLNAKDSKSRSVLALVCKTPNPDSVKMLLKKGANVNSADCCGWTALMHVSTWPPRDSSIEEKKIEIAKSLISEGADVNARDRKGRTALTYAVMNGDLELAMILITAGADINTPDYDDVKPLQHAVSSSFPPMVDLLKKHGATK